MTPQHDQGEELLQAEMHVKRWLRAIVSQSRRCEQAVIRVHEFVSLLPQALAGPRHHPGLLEDLDSVQLDQRTDEHFFLIALTKSLTWLQVLARWRPEYRQRIKEFRKSQPHAADIRNIWEHNDEYVQGRGKCRDRLHPASPTGSDSVNLDLHATDTAIAGGEYLLGGRVDVLKTAAEAERLYHELFTADV